MNLNAVRYLQNWARGILREWRACRHIPDATWRKVCQEHNVPLEKLKLDVDTSLVLTLDRNRIRFPKSPAAFRILSAYALLYELEANTDCNLSWDEEKDALRLTWGGATYLADNWEEIYILQEIYFSGDYDFAPAQPTVIVDVGANVGFTSIFLADSNPDIVIVACEPLSANFNKALRNIAENPHLAHRIMIHNIGLYSEDGVQTIISDTGSRGRSSIVIDRTIAPIGTVERATIKVRRVSAFIEGVKELYLNRRIVIKMDCEGSEYPILKTLKADGTIQYISGFIMEWHRLKNQDDGASYIRNFFTHSGFDVCLLRRMQLKSEVGMAYAFRSEH